MGIFDGYLILSDLDDTFRSGPGTVEKHSDAIRYFTANGGSFGFATGRGHEFLKQQDFFDLVNAPCSLYNGAYIYDYRTGSFLRKEALPFTVGEFVDAIAPFDPPISELWVYDRDITSFVGDEIYNMPNDVRNITALKLVTVLRSREYAENWRSHFIGIPLLENAFVTRSWRVGVEFTALSATKGHALDFIKDYLGNIHTTVGVGNFDNDIPLISHANIGFAVANAPEEVQKAADIILPACNEFGLCDLIDILETKMS